MLVDPEYLVEELMKEAAHARNAQAGGPHGERPAVIGTPIAMAGGYGSQRRQMTLGHVRLQGLMYDRSCSQVADALYEAYSNDVIDGVLLEVNTGGGQVSAAQMVSGAVTNSPKPVVTYAHYAASGGIMATTGSTEIVASGMLSTFGSIGVMMSLPKWMAKFYSDYIQELYADTSPDKNAAWREYMDGMKTERFTKMLNQIDQIFMAQVITDRSLPAGKLRDETLGGGTWLAQEAKRRGLVDSIGNFNYALTRLASHVADQN